jgi:hypothetical protein
LESEQEERRKNRAEETSEDTMAENVPKLVTDINHIFKKPREHQTG